VTILESAKLRSDAMDGVSFLFNVLFFTPEGGALRTSSGFRLSFLI